MRSRVQMPVGCEGSTEEPKKRWKNLLQNIHGIGKARQVQHKIAREQRVSSHAVKLLSLGEGQQCSVPRTTGTVAGIFCLDRLEMASAGVVLRTLNPHTLLMSVDEELYF